MNYNLFKLIGRMCLLLMIGSFVVGCNDDKEDMPPGLSVELEMIGTFPGDTVLVAGTASNYAGLASIVLSCENWEVNKVYDLSKHTPTVFNYAYQLIVPATATFDEQLTVTISDVNGKQTEKSVSMKYLPDTQAPVLQTALPDRISVDFDPIAGKGTWNLNLSFTDERELKELVLQVPGIGIDDTVAQTGRSGQFTRAIDFTEVAEFPATITIIDGAGNTTPVPTVVVVMLSEDEDDYEDYAQMYVVNAGENPDDYIHGYYRYMERKGEFQYSANIYVPADNTPVYFVPSPTLDGDLFGVSPHVNSKLMNKNGYVEPVILPNKGYYYVYIDIEAHTYEIGEYIVPVETYTGELRVTGQGFTIGDWVLSGEMQQVDTENPYRKTIEMELVEGYTGDYQYGFSNNDWSVGFHGDDNWWWPATSGANALFTPNYSGRVMVTFDPAELWATIKKID